jgi:hypothetical protein
MLNMLTFTPSTGLRLQSSVEMHLCIWDWFVGSYHELDIENTLRAWSPALLEV